MKISEDVLAVLDDITTQANTTTITRQLPRPLYVKVNKVLEACGGKWSRASKAHVFKDDARQILDAAIITGSVATAADIGFFPTPPDVARTLVGAADIRPGHTVLEPSAGTGALIDAIFERKSEEGRGYVFVIERDPKMRVALAKKYVDQLVEIVMDESPALLDFLDEPCVPHVDRVVMNPPFCKVGKGDHLDHVRHAFDFLKPGGILVSVLPSGVVFRQDRRHKEFRAWLDATSTSKIDLQPLPEGAFKVSGTSVNTVMLRMVKS